MTENDAIIQIKKTKKSISGKSSQKMKWSDEMLTEERLQGIERIVKEKGVLRFGIDGTDGNIRIHSQTGFDST